MLQTLLKAQTIKELLTSISHLKIALQYVWKASKRITIIRSFLIVLQSILPLIPLYLIKLLIDGLTEGEQNLVSLYWVISAFGFIQICLIVTKNITQYYAEIQGQLIANYMSTTVIEKAVGLDFKNFEDLAFNNSYHRARAQANTLPSEILNHSADLFQHGLTLLTLFGFLFTMHWSITVVLLFSAFPVAYVKLQHSRKKFELYRTNTILRRKAGYLNDVLTSPVYAKELHVFKYGTDLKNKFKAQVQTILDQTKALAHFSTKSITQIQLIEVFALLFAIVSIAKATLAQAISIGSMVMFYQGFLKAQSTLGNVFTATISLYYRRLFFSDLLLFLNLEEKEINENSKKTTQITDNELIVKDLFFQYPNTAKSVLTNINLNIGQKGLVALIGVNGSGKSTLVKLIAGLYEPSAGEVRFGNQPMSESLVAKHISILFQDFNKYEMSVRDNILIADRKNKVDEEQIGQVLDMVGLGFMKEMLDVHLSKSLEDGHVLSGGQWQRLALARAFYKNAKIYILDEPTSFVDPIHEEELMAHIKELSKNHLILLVTHKLYNLDLADEIILMEDGKVVDKGAYETLWERCELFKEMAEKQTNPARLKSLA